MKNLIIIEGIQIDNFILSLDGLVKKYEKHEFDINEHISKLINIKNQTCLIFCSSGTTGLPKGVEITQENVLSCLQTYRWRINHLERLHNESIIAFNIAPWFHVLGFMSMLMYACINEMIYVFLPKFEEKDFYKAIEVRTRLLHTTKSLINFLFLMAEPQS